MIEAIREVHTNGIIHRDIKPGNFCISSENKDLNKGHLCIIDFGLSKYYSIGGRHIMFQENK